MPHRLKSNLVMLVTLAVSLAACRIEKTPVRDPSQTATSVFINDASFNPDQMVEADWDKIILPTLRQKAARWPEVAAAIQKDPDAAGAKYGYREQATSPWTYAARFDGTVGEANIESRAATLTVKIPDAPDATLQIGPVIRGTAIRDILAYKPFGAFKNQVDYAQFGKALNARANATALSKLPRQDLAGHTVTALGVFQPASPGTPLLVTPVEISLGTKP